MKLLHPRAVVGPKDGVAGLEGAVVVPSTPNRSNNMSMMCPLSSPPAPKEMLPGSEGSAAVVPSTPRRSGSGSLTYPSILLQSRVSPREQTSLHDVGRLHVRGGARERMGSSDASCMKRKGDGAQSADFTTSVPVGIAASVPVLSGRTSLGGGGPKSVPASVSPKAVAAVNRSSLLAGSSLGQLISRITMSVQEQEQSIKRQQAEQRDIEGLLSRSNEELQQLISVVSQLHELQQSADMLQLGPERPRLHGKPPFFWQPSQEYAEEFEVSGENGEVVTKVNDFEDQGWVIPVGGAWRLMRGGIYRWTLRIERKCPSRPQLQLGIHGMNHSQPWRLITTSRCSWSRDDEPWQDRPGGDRLIDEGNYVHVEIDLRGVHSKCGVFALAINDEPFESIFDDIPLNAPYPLIPVVSMGGDQSRVRLCPSY